LSVYKLFYSSTSIKREDIITLKATPKLLELGYPKNYRVYRKVIALPGDTVASKDGQVYVNKKLLQGSFSKVPNNIENPVKLDSNSYAAISINQKFDGDEILILGIQPEDIVGKAYFRIFPFNRVGVVK
ncbi:MAG: S26 family signal peptidase, partial [Cyanobacteria bacterium J06643_5]